MKKVKGYLIGFGFIVLGVVIILFMFEHINKLYKNRIEITYTNEINENLEYNVKINYNIKDKENVLCSINNKDFLSIDKCQFNLKAGKYTLYLKREDNNITKDFEVKSKYLGTFSSALDKLEMYYLASNGKKKLNFTFDYPEDFDKKTFSLSFIL